MPKRKPNEEIFEDGDQSLRLVADFGFLEALNDSGRDVAQIFSDLSSGMMNPSDIKNIIISSLVDVDNEEVTESQKSEIAEDLINRYGLQECSVMTRVVLSHALIGDIKKSEAAQAAKYQTMIEAFLPSPSISLKKVGLLWVANCIISILVVCMIFNFYKVCLG